MFSIGTRTREAVLNSSLSFMVLILPIVLEITLILSTRKVVMFAEAMKLSTAIPPVNLMSTSSI